MLCSTTCLLALLCFACFASPACFALLVLTTSWHARFSLLCLLVCLLTCLLACSTLCCFALFCFASLALLSFLVSYLACSLCLALFACLIDFLLCLVLLRIVDFSLLACFAMVRHDMLGLTWLALLTFAQLVLATFGLAWQARSLARMLWISCPLRF